VSLLRTLHVALGHGQVRLRFHDDRSADDPAMVTLLHGFRLPSSPAETTSPGDVPRWPSEDRLSEGLR
jgi:hypothetical protein